MNFIRNTEIGISKARRYAEMGCRSPLVLNVVLLLKGAVVVGWDGSGWSWHERIALDRVVRIGLSEGDNTGVRQDRIVVKGTRSGTNGRIVKLGWIETGAFTCDCSRG